MPPLLLRLLPLKDRSVERPADAVLDNSVNWKDLAPVDFGWPEWGVEAFLAAYPFAILECLNEPCDSPVVLRQVNDVDLVFIDSSRSTATLMELKKQKAPGPIDAVCQLASNLAKACRTLLRVYPDIKVQTVVCGSWRDGQLARARGTVAWKYLQERGTSPRAIVYSGAQSQNGVPYLLLTEGPLPFKRKGGVLALEPHAELKAFLSQINRGLPTGLGLAFFKRLPGAVIRFTADSTLRTEYLKSQLSDTLDGPLATFFAVKEALGKHKEIALEQLIGQRLELRIDMTSDHDDEHAFDSRIRRMLSEIAHLVVSYHKVPEQPG